MICANINGTVTAILATYDTMKDRGYGKIVCPKLCPIFRAIECVLVCSWLSCRELLPCKYDILLIHKRFHQYVHHFASPPRSTLWG